MHRLKSAVRLGALALCALSTTSVAQPGGGHGVMVSQAWIRPTAPSAPTAAGYATLVNLTRQPDALVDATSPAADRLQIHRMTMDRGIMSMTAARGGVALPPERPVDLQRAGYHLMFIHPRRPFRAGDHVPVTLRFLRAGPVRVDFVVGEPGRAPGGMPGMRM